MKNLKESINATINYLDGHFQTIENGALTINEEYLRDSIEIVIDNTKHLIDAVTANRRSKVEAIVWGGLLELCDMELKHDGFRASGYHLKRWFAKYGKDYKVVLAPLVEAYKAEREEALN